jgi:imidazolonepropionase-like amidohydrolase
LRTIVATGLVVALGCAPAADEALVIAGLAVVDVETGKTARGLTVRIEGDRIVALGPDGEVDRRRARPVDGSGLWAIPGLWDMHFHSYGERGLLELAVAGGVTTVRDMGSVLESTLALRDGIEAGSLIGPTVLVGGPMLESSEAMASARQRAGDVPAWIEDLESKHLPVDGPEAAKEIVAELAARGVDHVKVRSVADEATLRALGDAARRHGLPLVGHPPWSLDPLVPAGAGQRTIEHAFYPYPLADLDAAKREAVFAAYRRHRVALVPTLIAWESRATPIDRLAAVVADRTGDVDERRTFLPESLIEHWRQDLAERGDGKTGGWAEALEVVARDVGEFHRAGVRVLAGTDAASFMVFPGFSLHDELALLVERAGLAPHEALAAASLRAAEVTGRAREVGALRAGAIADLVLLSADPTQNIRNTRSIEAVILRGRYLGRSDLDALLERSRRAAKGEAPISG